MALVPPIVCIISRARGTTGSTERRTLLDRLRAGAGAGAALVQVRERQLDDRELLAFVEEALEALEGSGARLVVNDRTDIARATGAGVHLKSTSASITAVRHLLPPGALVGRSVHSEEEARSVERDGGCDYLIFGTVFPSASKREGHPVAGLPALRAVCGSVSLPVLAIGGIDERRAAEVAKAGAAGAAAISLFAEARDVGASVAALRRALTPRAANV